jgi:uncharacterized membrane protein YedE/YeeE
MSSDATNTLPGSNADRFVVLLASLSILAISLLLQHEFDLRQALLFLTGIGLGVTLYHASFGFTGAWRHFIRERRGAGIRAQLLLLGMSSILFFPVLGQLFPHISAHAAIAPVGISVLVGAFLFGVGMQLGGGCGSGTLFTVGGGSVRMLITLTFFIVGAVIGSIHLPWWLSLPNAGKVSLIEQGGWGTALVLQLTALGALYLIASALEKRRHGALAPLADNRAAPFGDRFMFGPWPLWWGVIGLAMLNLMTLLIAGHPWSITFAFGLWGTKLWTALGGDISGWTYWSSGYPAQALSRSVLADTTSLMDFGLILGALLAAALAGKYAPESNLPGRSLIAAVIGGLLLGYGARLAFGCNIGALLAGISSGSLHGWLWLAAGFAGGIVGVRLRVLFGMDSPLEGK